MEMPNTNKPSQDDFLDDFGLEKNGWEEEWVDMPEFIQKKQTCYAQIIFRFDNEKNLQEFAKLIGQKLTKKTKSCWYPFKSHWGNNKKVWVDES